MTTLMSQIISCSRIQRQCSQLFPRFCPRFAKHPPFSRHYSGSLPIKETDRRDDAQNSGAVSDTDAASIDYSPICDAEQPEGYKKGGYHPVYLGDLLQARYRIVHKLGYGAYSTTWLARDELLSTWAAVKINRASVKESPESSLSCLLNVVDDTRKKHLGQNSLRAVLDNFTIQGPNGSHLCLVTTPARTTIAHSREASDNGLFKPEVARSITAQLAQAVAFVHSKGIVHADLHGNNIILRLSESIDNLTSDQIYEKYGQPEFEPVQRSDGQPLDKNVPKEILVPIWLGDKSDSIALADSGIFLIDFGVSFKPASTPRHRSHTPMFLRPPELYFEPTVSLSFPSDIWALACTMFSIQGRRSFFGGWFLKKQDMLRQYVEVLGRPPADWWSRWPEHSDIFDEDLNRKDGQQIHTLDDCFELLIQEPRRKEGIPVMDQNETRAFMTLMRSMLAFKPEDRPSADEVLQSEWMVKWAMKDLEKARQLFETSK